MFCLYCTPPRIQPTTLSMLPLTKFRHIVNCSYFRIHVSSKINKFCSQKTEIPNVNIEYTFPVKDHGFLPADRMLYKATPFYFRVTYTSAAHIGRVLITMHLQLNSANPNEHSVLLRCCVLILIRLDSNRCMVVISLSILFSKGKSIRLISDELSHQWSIVLKRPRKITS